MDQAVTASRIINPGGNISYTSFLPLLQSIRIIMADSDEGIQGVLRLCPRFNSRYKASFREHKDKLRVVLTLRTRWPQISCRASRDQKPPSSAMAHRPATRQPWWRGTVPTATYSVRCFFNTEKNANNTVRRHMGNTYEDGVGNGEREWAALQHRYHGNTEKAQREGHDQFYATMVLSGD